MKNLLKHWRMIGITAGSVIMIAGFLLANDLTKLVVMVIGLLVLAITLAAMLLSRMVKLYVTK